MLTPGGWPAWTLPPIRLIAPAPVGEAEAAWQRGVVEALGDRSGEDCSDTIGLGLCSAFELFDVLRKGARAALSPSPTDSELPSSVASRLRLAAQENGVLVTASPNGAANPARRSASDGLLALGAARSVSVVVPNYNYGRYIEARLREIDGQTYPVHEIIVLDDASTDDSLDRIAAAIPALRTPARLLSNVRNSGSAFKQWEKGVRAATGELVWIAEADDGCRPDFLAHLAPAFDDAGLAMAQSHSRQIGPQGEVRHDDYGFYLSEVGAERWTRSYRTDGGEQAASTLMVMNTVPNVSAVVFRRDILIEALAACAPVLEGFKLAGDWLVYLEVLSRGGFAFATQALNDHRVHDGSVTTSALTPLARVLEVARMQKIARDRMAPSAEVVAAATAYLQKLYGYFGLAEDAPSRVYDHPAFAPLAPGR